MSDKATPDVGMQVGGCPGGIAKLHKGQCDGGNNPNNGSGNTQRSAGVVAFGVGQQGGGFFGVIGTSISSPEFAGVVAHLVEEHGRTGNVNPYIYDLATKQAVSGRKIFHASIPGWNGIEQTDLNSSYSLSDGVGTPIVKDFVGHHDVEKAGNPQTPSNP